MFVWFFQYNLSYKNEKKKKKKNSDKIGPPTRTRSNHEKCVFLPKSSCIHKSKNCMYNRVKAKCVVVNSLGKLQKQVKYMKELACIHPKNEVVLWFPLGAWAFLFFYALWENAFNRSCSQKFISYITKRCVY